MAGSKGQAAISEPVRREAQITRKPADAKSRRAQREAGKSRLITGEPQIPQWVLSLFRFAAYRLSLPVNEFLLCRDAFGRESAYYYCPRCDVTLDRDYQAYCDRCGQRLDWRRIDSAKRRNPDT